jgi:predicted amidophosphoribosyltransferase
VASVAELSAPYGNFMLSPRHGVDTCEVCFNYTRGYSRCYACAHSEQWLAGVLPISYSVAGGQLHRALWGYKHLAGNVAERFRVELAAVLWRFVAAHEHCLAGAATVETFEVVTMVPSGMRDRDEQHPLHAIVGELVAPTRIRYEPLLERAAPDAPRRRTQPDKYRARRTLQDETVLLIDDTWTTGSSAQSAAAALLAAGAQTVAAIVIGRHMNRDWHENERRLRALERPFDWEKCAICAETA